MATTKKVLPETEEVFDRLERLGLAQKDLADHLGVEPNKISKTKKGERQFKGMELPRAIAWLDAHEARNSRGLAPDIPLSRSADGGETVEIIMLDLSVSMGPGSEIHGLDNFVEGEPVQFDLGLLRAITTTSPARLRLIKGIGDSMFPTLLTGDRVMVDTTERTYSRIDGVYWVNHLGAQGIKRLRAITRGRILIKSDNPAVPDNEVDAEDLLIHGRAIWFAREL